MNQDSIDNLEKFICENAKSDAPSVSPQHLESQRSCFKQITAGNVGGYAIFGGNGFSSYAYYKSKSEKIYTIVSFMGELSGYTLIE